MKRLIYADSSYDLKKAIYDAYDSDRISDRISAVANGCEVLDISNEDDLALLQQFASDPSEKVRMSLVKYAPQEWIRPLGLDDIKAEWVQSIKNACNSSDKKTKIKAIAQCCEFLDINNRSDFQILKQFANDPSPMVRMNLAKYCPMGWIGLLDLEKDNSKWVQEALKWRLPHKQLQQKSARLPFSFSVYSYDLDAGDELDWLKGFSSTQKEAAIQYAQRYADKHSDEGLGAHVVIKPKDDSSRTEQWFDENSEYSPWEIVWASYE